MDSPISFEAYPSTKEFWAYLEKYIRRELKGGVALTADELKQRFKYEDAEVLYNKLILGNDVWYFRNVLRLEPDIASSRYDEMKHYISDKLKIHFNNICIVGSAKTGFSLKTPQFAGFRKESQGSKLASDIDIAIICDKRFHQFWNILLEMKRKGQPIRDYAHVTSCVFRKFIRTDVIPENYDEVKHWNSLVDEMIKDFQIQFEIFHESNLRLYESWDGLKNYQMEGILRVQNLLSRGEA